MAQKIETAGLSCLCSTAGGLKRIAYVLYPMDILSGWIDDASRRYSTAIVVVTGMDWQNVFSPWPARGVPKGCPDFKGESGEFLQTLRRQVLPAVEKALEVDVGVGGGVGGDVERSLGGVSMSGLFALWQWAVCDTFVNIASLSGSFWYEGFVEWFSRQDFSRKTGKAYFLLGDQETQAKAFSTVGANTAEIVDSLRRQGVDVEFESVPGNHYADPIPRLEKAFAGLGNM